jgi:hypothetical protein
MAPYSWTMAGSAALCSRKAMPAQPVPRCYSAISAKATPPTGHSRALRACLRRPDGSRPPWPSSAPSSPGDSQRSTVSTSDLRPLVGDREKPGVRTAATSDLSSRHRVHRRWDHLVDPQKYRQWIGENYCEVIVNPLHRNDTGRKSFSQI